MLRTFVSELMILINSDPAWKVSKGSRSASRRARKTVAKSLKNRAGVICRSSEASVMPVAESEKHGSTVGCFIDKAEHLPIKKRRFLLRTPSPPPPPSPPPSPPPPGPVLHFPPTEEIADHIKIQDASNKLAAEESAPTDINPSHFTDNNFSNHAKKSEKSSEKFGEDEDFSGISILAAAACSNSLGRECDYAEDRSCVETVQKRAQETYTSVEEPSSPRGLLKEDIVNSSEMSTGGTSSCVSTEPVVELASLLTTVNSSQNVENAGKGIKEASLGAGSLTLSWDVTCSKDEETVGNQRPASRDGRLHWNLNVVMDAWEQPLEDPDAQNELQHKKFEDGGKYDKDDKGESFEGQDSQDNLTTTFAEQKCMLPGEPEMWMNRTLEGNKENNDVGACHKFSQPLNSDEKSRLSNCKYDPDFMKCMVEDNKRMRHHESVNATDKFVTVSDHGSRPSESGTVNEYEDASAMSLELSGDGHHNGRLTLEVLSSCGGASSCELKKLSGACTSDTPSASASADIQTSRCVSSSPCIRRDVVPNLAVMDNRDISQGLHDHGDAIEEKFDLKTSKSIGHAHIISTKKSLPYTSCSEPPVTASTKCEVLVTLDATKVQDVSGSQGGKLVCNNETTLDLFEIHPVIKKETCDTLCHGTCKPNVDTNSIFSDKVDTAEPHDHRDGVDFNCHPVSVVGANAESELQEDYDSQFEDGELRETNECAWDEYVVKEVEHVDYGHDDMETCTAIPGHYHVSDSQQVEDKKNVELGIAPIVPSNVCNIDNEVLGKAAENVGNGTCDKDNKIKPSNPAEEKMKAPRSEELLECSKSSSDMTTGAIDHHGINNAMSSYGDGMVDCSVTETRTETKACRRGLRSQIEGPVEHDVSSRAEQQNKMESRCEESSSMRSFERVRYFHNHGRGHVSLDGSLEDHRGFKRHYSPILHDQGHPKVGGDGIVERDDIRCFDTQNDAYVGLHSRCKHDRKFSPDRPATFVRGRSFRYGPSDYGRGGRGRYNGPSRDESFQSLKYWRPFSRRERSISPFQGRENPSAYHSRGKSPSGSRSRSPIMWHSQRGRRGAGSGGNTFLRHRSRSPNFRSDVRVQRLRSPHHQPGFGENHAMGFRSFPRNHVSPSRGRWTPGQKEELGHFREIGYKQRTSALEGSPGRNRMRGDRAGVIDSARNIKPDGYYRISDRISEDGAGRGLRYEENYEDRRKHYVPLHPTRRSYEDGMGSRLHQDVDDSFVANRTRDRDASSFQGRGLRGIHCRIGDPSRRLRVEQHSFLYERDGRFNSNSKQFGVDVMDSSSNLQFEEQYQSTHAGRFSEMDGINRVRRYESFEDRRKQYGGVIRCSDMEGTEKRLNHNVDENFQDAPDFRGRSMRSFDGRIGSLSTRLDEDRDPVVCRQEEKLDDNAQSFNMQNSDDDNMINGRIA